MTRLVFSFRLPAVCLLAVLIQLCQLCGLASAAEWRSFPLRDNGTIPIWTIAGPFPNGKPYRHGPGCFGYYTDFLKQVGGEGSCVPSEGDTVTYNDGKQVTWRTAFTNSEGLLDYIDALGVDKETPGVVYAFCRLESPDPRKVFLKVLSNDGARIWLNGEMIHDNHLGRTVDEGGEDRVKANLRRGTNDLLMKIDQGAGGWEHLLILSKETGEPLRGLTVQVQTAKPIQGKISSASFATSYLVEKTTAGPRQIMVAHILSGGLKNVVCQVSKLQWEQPQVFPLGDLPIGRHRLELPIPVVSENGPARIRLESSTDRLELNEVLFRKPRQWTIDLVQHTHTDIGYTRPQDELFSAFLRHIDIALDYCDLTDDYPDDAKFRWTCEVSWAVREFLRRRPPEQIERLKKRIAEGRIEVTALYLNMLETADESLMATSLEPIREFRKLGFPVTTGVQNDVPGAAWCLVDFFSDIDVKYLVMGINNDMTPRPFDRPTAFWWESPAGKRVLAWRPDHYHTGNHLRIHQLRLEPLKINTLEYLELMEAKGYPFDRIAVQYSGLQIDNSPPNMAECELIRKWNEKYAWPKMRSATIHEFPEYIARHHAEDLPVYRGAWPNWWTHGVAFANVETAEGRAAGVDLGVVEVLFSMAKILGAEMPTTAEAEIDKVRDDLLFFNEHTFGAQEEFSNPMAENTVVQWGEKVAHLWDAVKDIALLRETAFGTLRPYVKTAEVPTIAVFNTLTWKRSGPIDVYIGHEMLPLDREFRLLDVKTGEEVRVQRMRSRFEGSYWKLWVDEVPPLGWKTIRLELGGMKEELPKQTAGAKRLELENSYYRLTVNAETGSISTLIDKESGRELVDQETSLGFGQFIVDRLTDNHFYDRDSFLARSTRSSLRNVKIEPGDDGPIWKSLRIVAEADGCLASEEKPAFLCEIRLYEREKRIDFTFEIRKLFVDSPESVYVAFPFGLKDGTFQCDVQGGTITPGVDQLPGSSADWHTMQNFVSLRDDKTQIVFGSDRVPIVQFGDINVGKWQYIANVEKPHLFSWVINNYWTYHLRGNTQSEFRWNYSLTSTEDTSRAAATRFGWSTRVPLTAVVFPASARTGGAPGGSTLSLRPPNVLAVSIQPSFAGEGLILHLREVNGERTKVEWAASGLKPKRIDTLNVLGEVLERGIEQLWLDPYEVKFVRLLHDNR